MRVAVIGGGLCGLTCAIRLGEKGVDVDLFESAPSCGGRTRSFFETAIGEWVDNGPHLLLGAYRHTRRLLQQAGAEAYVRWQTSLSLPLWQRERGLFRLSPSPRLPLALALPWACGRLPGHGWASMSAVLRLGAARSEGIESGMSVAQWLQRMRIPEELVRDLLAPLTLAAMNETLDHANARSFARVLQDAFADHDSARLGWFTRPLCQALIEPLVQLASRHGVCIHTKSGIKRLRRRWDRLVLATHAGEESFNAAVLALPAHGRNRLLGQPAPIRTQAITNVHLWLRRAEPLPAPLIGSIGMRGQWYFDISQQMQSGDSTRHICVVISASGVRGVERRRLLTEIRRELEELMPAAPGLELLHHRIVCERHATTSVSARIRKPELPPNLIDAVEAPAAGDLPATIEAAVRRGDEAASLCLKRLGA